MVRTGSMRFARDSLSANFMALLHPWGIMDDTPALRFAQVTKRYGPKTALTGFSLEIRQGEFFGLLGVNGAGKTTLLKCMLDFCAVDSGEIQIFGTPHRVTRSRSRLAFLPERFSPPFYLTGRDFLQYMSQLHHTAYKETLVQQVFQSIDLDVAALDKPARSYSKGMTQKLGLAACLLSGKDLQILDEPASGLDPKARALFKRELAALRDGRRTVFFSSHALGDVEQLCDRVGVVHNGELLFAGTPDELKSAYGDHDMEQAFLACIGEKNTVEYR
jgi:ABC-2 type transport system ATP-binding protein